MHEMNTIKNRTIQIRMTSEEKEQIMCSMREEGFNNLSAWIRNRLLDGSGKIEQKISEMYRLILAREERRSVAKNFSKDAQVLDYFPSAILPSMQVHIVSYKKEEDYPKA